MYETIIPISKRPHSIAPSCVKILRMLTPNITGIARKNENSAATVLDVPNKIAPKIVAPDRDVPGIIEGAAKGVVEHIAHKTTFART